MFFKHLILLLENRAQELLDISNSIKDSRQREQFQVLIPLLSLKSESSKKLEYVFYKDHISLMREFAIKFNLVNGVDRLNHFFFEFPFKDKKILIRSTGQDPFAKKRANANSAGRKLANAGELATILSLTKDIETPEDTEQQFFIDNPEFFDSWKNTFIQTRKAINKIVGDISQFDIEHDATGNSEFLNLIKKIIKKAKPNPRAGNTWNPADIYLVRKSAKKRVEKEISDALEDFDNQKINQLILKLYHEKALYPISLKQIISSEPKISYENETQEILITNDPIEFHKLPCNLTMDTKEVGVFEFLNTRTGNKIKMQFRGFPHGYVIGQMEITSDGSKSGGRLGKVPTNIVSQVMQEYNDDRISSMKFFGRKHFEDFDDKKIHEVYSWLAFVRKFKFVEIVGDLSLNELSDLVEIARKDMDIAAKLAIKIQGLKIIKFFCENRENISKIISKLINGSKKSGDSNAFYIKIY